MGQWLYSLWTGKLTATMQIAKRVHSIANIQNDPALMTGAYRALAVTLYFLGHFESARAYAMRGVQTWRSWGAQSSVEEVTASAIPCLGYQALSAWQLGEIASCHAAVEEAISLARQLHNIHGLAVALTWAAILGYSERNLAEVERCSSDVIELSTRHHFAFYFAAGFILRGWTRSGSGDTAEGISLIENGIRDYRATGAVLRVPFFLGLKAEALYLADRTSEALEAISEAEALVERFEDCHWCAELHRLRAVFLANIGADEAKVLASFCEAIRIAKEQNSISLEKRAEATYAEYRRQKASGSGGRGFRLPLW
jgi:predicted ATPase